jgi:hypothetical protein
VLKAVRVSILKRIEILYFFVAWKIPNGKIGGDLGLKKIKS